MKRSKLFCCDPEHCGQILNFHSAVKKLTTVFLYCYGRRLEYLWDRLDFVFHIVVRQTCMLRAFRHMFRITWQSRFIFTETVPTKKVVKYHVFLLAIRLRFLQKGINLSKNFENRENIAEQRRAFFPRSTTDKRDLKVHCGTTPLSKEVTPQGVENGLHSILLFLL